MIKVSSVSEFALSPVKPSFSASIEFYLGFTYYFAPTCRIAGEASVVIEVHVLFFSTSVTATMRREFADPKISVADLIGPADWASYCEAFAD